MSDKLEQATPAQHHESTAASRDRAYHVLRGAGVERDAAKKIAEASVEKAKRARDK